MTGAKVEVILVADDDENDVFFIERALKEAQVANPLRRVRDGEEAIAYLKGEGGYGDREKFPLPHLMLLDLKMPRKNGFEVLEWVRGQPGLKRLPVIILTSSKEDPDIKRAYDLGANTYLVKPAKPEGLVDMAKASSFTGCTWRKSRICGRQRAARSRLESSSRSGLTRRGIDVCFMGEHERPDDLRHSRLGAADSFRDGVDRGICGFHCGRRRVDDDSRAAEFRCAGAIGAGHEQVAGELRLGQRGVALRAIESGLGAGMRAGRGVHGRRRGASAR